MRRGLAAVREALEGARTGGAGVDGTERDEILSF